MLGFRPHQRLEGREGRCTRYDIGGLGRCHCGQQIARCRGIILVTRDRVTHELGRSVVVFMPCDSECYMQALPGESLGRVLKDGIVRRRQVMCVENGGASLEGRGNEALEGHDAQRWYTVVSSSR